MSSQVPGVDITISIMFTSQPLLEEGLCLVCAASNRLRPLVHDRRDFRPLPGFRVKHRDEQLILHPQVEEDSHLEREQQIEPAI